MGYGAAMPEPPRVFISVAEDSADLHASSLVRTARQALPNVTFHGLTGPRLRGLGVETVFDMTAHATMLSGILGALRRGREALAAAERSWDARRPDLVIVMDSSALHLPMAKRAKRRGLPVLYYIAPQTWASRPGRNRVLARNVDRVACILPFEEAHFLRHGVAAEYVGHPLFEALAGRRVDETRLAELRASGRPVVAVLPGSRRQVVEAVLPKQLEVARLVAERMGGLTLAISAVSEEREAQIRSIVVHSAAGSRSSGSGGTAFEGAAILRDDNATLLTAADLALVASGTATLEVAAYRKPMVVMYDAGRLMRVGYWLGGRRLLHTPHLALVNVLAGARVVPEFMPFLGDLRPIAEVAARLISDRTWRELMVQQLDALVQPLEGSRASERVCALAAAIIGRQVDPLDNDR